MKLLFKVVIILLLKISLLVSVVAQQFGVESNYLFGTNIPIHPRYPKINDYTHTSEIALLHRTKGKKIWSLLYKEPTVSFLLAYQTLGNSRVLGQGFYFVPSIDFNLFSFKRFDMKLRVGWGVGITTRIYDSINNPENIVMGSHVNACATLRALFRYRLWKQMYLVFGGGITHYSNGGLNNPNLGLNIPFLQFGIQYFFNWSELDNDKKDKVLSGLPKLNQSIRPFLRIGLGLTEVGPTNGPKYPIYIIAAGASRLMARISKLSLSFEYLYNFAVFSFDRHNGGIQLEHLNYARFSIIANHELLFGHWGFVTGVGAYFNDHRYRRSVILTKIGFNFYLKNYFKKFNHQLWIGCHIRAYSGEAEFVEFVLGYNL